MKNHKRVLISLVLLLTVIFIFGCNMDRPWEIESEPRKKVEENTEKHPEKEPKSMEPLEVSSSAFNDGEEIPVKYSVDMQNGKNVSIPLEWKNVPEGSTSIAVTMIDKTSNNFLHWLVFNIDPKNTSIEEGASGKNMPRAATELINDYGKKGYGGPGPPPGEKHEYEITIWALNASNINLREDTGWEGFQRFITESDSVIGKTVITGTFLGKS